MFHIYDCDNNFLTAGTAKKYDDLKLFHIYDDSGKKLTLDKILKGDQADLWNRSTSNEFGRLAQGNKYGIKYRDVMEFITKQEVPKTNKVTYASFVLNYRPLKAEPWRVRLVVGGDKLPYDDDAGSPAASLIETKLLINSVISDASKGAKFMSLDLKDFFLMSAMQSPEFMKIHKRNFPPDIIDYYNLKDKIANDDYVYIKIKKGMYGLKQAALLGYEQLIQHLKPFGYYPIPHTEGLWKHKSRKITFCLCVDDFGVKYFHQSDVEHLMSALQQKYDISSDWTGTHFCGLSLNWHYQQGYVDISMPKYIEQVLHKFQHKNPSKTSILST